MSCHGVKRSEFSQDECLKLKCAWMEERTKGLIAPPYPQQPGAIPFALQYPPEPEDDHQNDL